MRETLVDFTQVNYFRVYNTTPGEKKAFLFLREAARPDSDFIGWYEPVIGEQGREPAGPLVLEVKGWLIDQIEESVRSYLYGRGGRLMIDFAMDPK